jgi:D-lactate dehydrogenase (cytochrome)
VEAVLPTGEVITATRDTAIPDEWPSVKWDQPEVKSAAGFYSADNLLDLIIGQEGALAIITQATIRLTTPSESFFSIFALFDSEADALNLVEILRDDPSDYPGVSPSSIEWFDGACLELIRAASPSFPKSGAAGVWCEQEVTASALDDSMEQWFDILERHNADLESSIFAQDKRAHNEIARLRHAIPAGINEQVVANKMTKVGTDCSVPNSALREMMEEYKRAPMESYLFGHIGDNHLHLNLLPKSASELKLAKLFYRQLCRKAVALGGSVSAEHGIGKLKREHLAEMVGQSTLSSFVALKRHLDPAWILGRGNVIAQSSTES